MSGGGGFILSNQTIKALFIHWDFFSYTLLLYTLDFYMYPRGFYHWL
jgi:hypothetical protein